MLIDLHTHTNRYSGCSILSPSELIHWALKLGLDGIAITEHYNVWSKEEIEELKRKEVFTPEFLILRGQEVLSSIGHLLIFGLYETLPKDLSIEKLLEKVHIERGLVIMAHPFRYGWGLNDDFESLKSRFVYVDGIEVFSGNQNEEENQHGRRVWETLKITGVGGSDAHSIEMVGKCFTEFYSVIKNEDDLIKEIKAGRCKPRIL